MSYMGVRAASSVAGPQSVGVERLSNRSSESLPGLVDAQPQNFRRAMFGIPHAFKQGGLKIQHAISKAFQATKRACVTRFGTRASEDLINRRRSSSNSELALKMDTADLFKLKDGAEPKLKSKTGTGDLPMDFTRANTDISTLMKFLTPEQRAVHHEASRVKDNLLLAELSNMANQSPEVQSQAAD
ncbi:hypothetical protein [Bordetella sp. LUAb4]|uniref:hypothetical protein n=1 Tax=Bordetella sp. LUAb4 TaxID=2843195 RepID=UPI001E505ABC|nr:hypothetical protein [Bordetella sp. LUAb4]